MGHRLQGGRIKTQRQQVRTASHDQPRLLFGSDLQLNSFILVVILAITQHRGILLQTIHCRRHLRISKQNIQGYISDGLIFSLSDRPQLCIHCEVNFSFVIKEVLKERIW